MGAAMTARERLYAALDENTCFCSGCEDKAGPSLDVYDARVTAAAYRAAADEIQAEADSLNIPGSPATPDAIRGMTHAADHLRARADEMGQQ